MSLKKFAFNLIDKYYLYLLGPFYFVAVFSVPLSVYFSEKVSKGYNLIWVTLIILGVFIYIQLKKLSPFHNSESIIRYFNNQKKTIRWYFYFINMVGAGIFIYFLMYYYQSYHNQIEPRIAFYGYPILATIWYTIWSFLFGAVAIGMLYSLIYMGPISNGVSLAITFHNWANGMGINYQVFIQYIIDFSMPDILALLLNLLWLVVSYNFTKSVDA